MSKALDKAFEKVTRIFNPADIQVSRSASIIKPKVVATMIKKAKHPVLVTGGRLLEDKRLVDFVVRLHEKTGIGIIATGGSSKPLIERGINPQASVFSLHFITQYLLDESWNGFDGKGRYDVVVFIGFTTPYYLSRMLSALKHFSNLNTISICEYYQPHAKFSFPNLDGELYYEALNAILEV
jgi:acetyl-CoA decarbonylase/synthase complex subunit epsilon